MITILIPLGLLAGFLSGFFGIGGGTFLVPALMVFGFNIKEAIAISVVQMVFASVTGSYFNLKNSSLNLKTALLLGGGGFVGALFSGFVLKVVPAQILHYMFLLVVLFAIARFFMAKPKDGDHDPKSADRLLSKLLLLALGFAVGMFSISLGVGGAILIGPLLVGFFGYKVKDAVVYSLFFVIFSSIAGSISMFMYGHVDLLHGAIIGVFSVFGVYAGVKALNKVDAGKLRKYLIVLYIVIFAIMLKKTFF